jgi:uncharacterized protein (TIGR02594 family)
MSKILKAFEIAKTQIGVKEIVGKKHNPKILEFGTATSLKPKDDETPWCATSANWCLMKAGIKGTNSAAARSFLKWGTKIDVPFEGCLVVFWRGSKTSSKGHVAFYVRETAKYIYCLGGNQGNEFCIAKYPKEQLLSYRSI